MNTKLDSFGSICVSSMIHSVVASDNNNNILQVIACFSEQQVVVAKRNILKEFPKAHINVRITPDDHLE
jgi:hypothetical protein